MAQFSGTSVNSNQPRLFERFLLSVIEDETKDNPKIDFVATPTEDGGYKVALRPFHGDTFKRDTPDHNRAKQVRSYILHDLGYTSTHDLSLIHI